MQKTKRKMSMKLQTFNRRNSNQITFVVYIEKTSTSILYGKQTIEPCMNANQDKESNKFESCFMDQTAIHY